MIFSRNTQANEKEFVQLLEATKIRLIELFKSSLDVGYTKFEEMVFEAMSSEAIGTAFEDTIEQTSAYAFPDIVANGYFGIEVKHTVKNHWTSTGNSILETNRVEGVEKIYMFFGKFGGDIAIKYRPYQECLHAVSVTHSPRYRIDMNLAIGQSIFDKMQTDYDVLREAEEPIKIIKEYYRSQLKEGEEMWWIDSDTDDREVSPIIKPFRSLDKEIKNKFFLESIVLFPEMFGTGNSKFERAAAYLVSEYNAVHASLRDLFSAGGRQVVKTKEGRVAVGQLYYKVLVSIQEIKDTLHAMDEDKLLNYWRLPNLEPDRVQQWLDLVSEYEPDNIEIYLASILGSEDYGKEKE